MTDDNSEIERLKLATAKEIIQRAVDDGYLIRLPGTWGDLLSSSADS